MRQFLITAFLALIATVSMNAQNKIGVVDFIKVAEQMPEAIEFDTRIKNMQANYADTVQQRQAALMQKRDELQKQASMMTQDMMQQKQAEMQAELMDIQRYQQEKLGQQGELVRLQNEFMIPFREKIVKAIQDVAKKEQISVVLDKSQVLFSEDALEITFSVIDKLKRGS
jgi:outer membrane protein